MRPSTSPHAHARVPRAFVSRRLIFLAALLCMCICACVQVCVCVCACACVCVCVCACACACVCVCVCACACVCVYVYVCVCVCVCVCVFRTWSRPPQFDIIVGGALVTVDGTSCAAPTFSGIVALLNDVRLNLGKPPLGFLNPLFYQNPTAFNDIVVRTTHVLFFWCCCRQSYPSIWVAGFGLSSLIGRLYVFCGGAGGIKSGLFVLGFLRCAWMGSRDWMWHTQFCEASGIS